MQCCARVNDASPTLHYLCMHVSVSAGAHACGVVCVRYTIYVQLQALPLSKRNWLALVGRINTSSFSFSAADLIEVLYLYNPTQAYFSRQSNTFVFNTHFYIINNYWYLVRQF